MARSVCHVCSVLFCYIHPSIIHPSLSVSRSVCLSMILHICPSVAKSMVFLWNWATFMLLPWAVFNFVCFVFFSLGGFVRFWCDFGDFYAILTARFPQNVIRLVLVVIGLGMGIVYILSIPISISNINLILILLLIDTIWCKKI